MNAVATQNPTLGTASRPKSPAPGQDITALIKRAAEGDESYLPEVQALLADGDRGLFIREYNGSSAKWIRRSIIGKAAGENVLVQEAIRQKLDEVQSDLEGPNPTPIERLLAERASLCWFIVHLYENAYANADGWNIAQVDLQQRKIAKAHARLLSAVRTLAQVRKLALPDPPTRHRQEPSQYGVGPGHERTGNRPLSRPTPGRLSLGRGRRAGV